MYLLGAGIFVLVFAGVRTVWDWPVFRSLMKEEYPEKEFRFSEYPVDLLDLIVDGVIALTGIVLIVLHFAGVG